MIISISSFQEFTVVLDFQSSEKCAGKQTFLKSTAKVRFDLLDSLKVLNINVIKSSFKLHSLSTIDYRMMLIAILLVQIVRRM